MSDLSTIGFRADTSGLTKAQAELKKTTVAGRGVDTSIKSVSGGMLKLAGTIGVAVSAAAGLRKTLDITRQFDVLNAQLITATGSAKNAAIAFDGISQFAANTPYDLAQATDSFTKLVNLGLNPSEKALISYGNTASAMGKSLNQFIEAVADASTNEFERLKEFGIKTKQEGDNVTFTFRGMSQTVEKEAGAIEEYLQALGENEFAGAMANRMDTLDGKISNLGDSWDMLFLNVSQAGVGDLMLDSVSLALDAVNELDDFLQSGQLAQSFTILGTKFAGFASDIEHAIKYITELFTTGSSLWGEDIEKFISFMRDSLINMPENFRAAIQLTAVEIGALVDYAEAYGSAFGKVLGIKLAQAVESAKVYGKAIGEALNPFSDGSTDIEAELERLSNQALSMTNKIFADAQSQAEMTTDARRLAIDGILEERNAAIEASDAQINKLSELGTAYDELNKKRKEETKEVLGQFKIKKDGSDDEIKSSSKQKDGIEDLISLSSQYFSEKTAASKTFSAISQALAIKDIATSAASAAASVTAGAAKLFEQSGWLGFAGVTAMMGVMASIGFSGSSGSSSSAPTTRTLTGTGTVYGDNEAQSESIANGINIIADVSIDQLAELKGLRLALNAVETGLATVGAAVVGNTTLGGISSLNYISSSAIGVRSNSQSGSGTTTSSSSDLVSSVSSVMNNVESSIVASSIALGLGIESAIDEYIIKPFIIDLDGLDSAEQKEKIDAVFSSIFDNMVSSVAPIINDFKQVGEGAFETLIRVTNEQAIFNDALDFMGMSLNDLSAIMQIDVAQSIITLVGGLETFSDLTSTFFTEFLSEEEQFAYSTKSLTEALSGLNVGLFESRDLFTEYMRELEKDLTSEDAQKLFAGLLELVPALDSYYDEIESAQEDALATELALIDEAKSARLSALQQEQAILSSVVSKFLPSAQTAAITALSALDAARKGDFSLANSLSVPTISASDYSSNVDYMIAQAQQSATLAEIGRLANEQLSEVDTQISLLDEQNYILTEINDNIIAQNTAETSIKNTQSVENSAKITEMQAQQQSVNESMARNIARMANDVSTIKNNGVSVYTISSDTLSVTVV